MTSKPHANPNGQFVIGSSGEIYALLGANAFVLPGVSPDLLRNLLSLADGTRSVAAICREMAEHHDSTYVLELVNLLSATHLLEDAKSQRSPIPEIPFQMLGVPPEVLETPVAVLGNRALHDVLSRTFSALGFSRCRTFSLRDLQSCTAPSFVRFIGNTFCVGTLERSSQPVLLQHEVLNAVDVPMLTRILQDFAFVLCVLEGVPLQALFDVNHAALESRVPCLFVIASPEEATIGPTVIRGGTACFRCRAIFAEGIPPAFRDVLPYLSAPTAGSDTLLLSLIARACMQEVAAILGPSRMPLHAASLLRIRLSGEQVRNPILPDGKCPECGVPPSESPSALAQAATAGAIVEVGQIWPISPMAEAQPAKECYRSVGILGGGTAGYLAALAFREFHPGIDVTLIESSAVPIIGVGEATTPELVKFLHSHRFLARDIVDLFERVGPTWKLGIKFRWGLPGDYAFTFPFQRGRLLESHLYESTINQQSLGAMLMMAVWGPGFSA